MIKIEFTEEEMNALEYERYHHPHPRVQRKMEALWLKSQNRSYEEICQLTGISPNTLVVYLRKYQECGIEGLKEGMCLAPPPNHPFYCSSGSIRNTFSTTKLLYYYCNSLPRG